MKRILCSLAFIVLAAPATASMAQEPPLICFGTEPFWRLDLTQPGKASFSTPDCPAAEDYVGAASTLAPRKETVWRGRATVPNGGELVAFLREGACSDGMSDTAHPYSVSVSLPDGTHRAGCCRLAEAPTAAASLENTSWRLTTLPGASLPDGGGRNAITVAFEAGRVHGFSGCNQFFGSYAQKGEKLELGSLGATMMACAEPAMSIENLFLKSFAGDLRLAVVGNELTLMPQSGGDALRFERAAPPRLEGVKWEVTGYNNGRQAVVSPKLGTRITLMFSDGMVSGSSGCNRFHGSFKAEGKALTIQPLATTRMACEEDVMAQEQEFLRALQSATTWTIVRGMLDVHRADGERVLTASEAGE
jgi:heat shock protein HslJ